MNSASPDSDTLWVLGQKVTIFSSAGDYDYVEIVAPASVPGPPPHVHQDCSELFHVLEGELEVMRDGKWAPLKPGQCASVPRGTLHTFRNPAKGDVRFISVFSPKGFATFFRELGVGTAEANARERSVGQDRIARVMTDAGRYGMQIPPPTA